MELKGKKVLVFGAGKSGIGAADLLGAVGACPILYDGKADLDKESVLHKTRPGQHGWRGRSAPAPPSPDRSARRRPPR